MYIILPLQGGSGFEKNFPVSSLVNGLLSPISRAIFKPKIKTTIIILSQWLYEIIIITYAHFNLLFTRYLRSMSKHPGSQKDNLLQFWEAHMDLQKRVWFFHESMVCLESDTRYNLLWKHCQKNKNNTTENDKMQSVSP